MVDLDLVVTFDNILERDDGIRTLRHDTAGCDPHRLTGAERARHRGAGGDPRDHRKAPGRIRGAQRKAVHRRARERRQIDEGVCILREHAAGRLCNGHALCVERPHPLQDARLSFGEREQLRHRAQRSAAVTSQP